MTRNQRLAQSLRRVSERLRDEPHEWDVPMEHGELEYLLKDAAEALEKGEKT